MIRQFVPPPNYNVGSVDLTPALNMALGIAEERKQEQRQAEAGQALAKVANLSPDNPDFVKTMGRLQQLDPQMAQFGLQMAQYKGEQERAERDRMLQDWVRTNQALVDAPDKKTRDTILSTRIAEMRERGRDTSKLEDLLGMSDTDQRLQARANVILGGDLQSLANMGTQDALQELKIQGQQLKNMQTAQQMELRQREEQRRTREEQRELQTAEQEQTESQRMQEAQNESLRGQAQFIADQAQLAANIAREAPSGWVGSAAALASPTGQSARLRRILETIRSNIGFDQLMEMKRQSPTGGALGAVSERELSNLQAVLGELDPRQSDQDLVNVLNQVVNFYSKINQSAGGQPLPPITIDSGGGNGLGDLQRRAQQELQRRGASNGF